MHADKNHITTYSAADIQKYLRGELPADDMHAMEKAALDDPFLADAIEGMEQAMQEDPAIIHTQLTDLRRQLTARTGQEKAAVVRPFRWWYAAAAASVVIIASIWIYTEMNTPKEAGDMLAKTQKEGDSAPEQVASIPTPAADSTVAAATTPAPNAAPATTKATADMRDQQKKEEEKVIYDHKAANQEADFATNKPVSRPAQSQPQSLNSLLLKKTDTAGTYAFSRTVPGATQNERKPEILLRGKTSGIEVLKDKKFDNNVSADTLSMPTEVVKVTDDLRSKQVYKLESGNSNTSNLQNFIKGRVTDQRNNPISNAALRIENTRNIYNTDQLGYFKIPATDSVVNVSVDVVGYQPQQFKLNNLNAAAGDNNLAANQLRLQANELALSEVTVVGYGAKRKQAAMANKYPSVMVQDAAPAYGWVLFEQYLQKNKKPPADNPLVTGEVVLSFMVNKKGELSDFTIEQSLAKGYDEEAIRLVKEGPAWKLQKGRKAKVTVIVRF